MAYIVRLWTPCEDDPRSSEAKLSVACATMTQAWDCAVRLLRPLTKQTTWELRAHCHRAEAEIVPPTGKSRWLDSVEYVESIGDRLRRGEAVFV